MKFRLVLAALVLSVTAVACHFATGNPTGPWEASGYDASVDATGAPPLHMGALAIETWNGDLDGSTAINKIVTGLQGKPLPTLAAGALSYDGGSWYFGPASVSPGTAGQALFTDDAGAATVWVKPHGDVDASTTDPGALTVIGLQQNPVASGTPTTGNQLRWSGTAWGGAALNLAGGSGYVTGTLPTTNQAAQSLGGDLSGTTASASVVGLTGAGSVITVGASTFDVTGSTLSLADNGAVTRDVFNLDHGRIRAGGGGSDYKAEIGPIVGNEAAVAGLYLLPGATSASGTNWTVKSDGASFTALNSATGFSGLAVAGTIHTYTDGSVFATDLPVLLAPGSGNATIGDIRAANNTVILAARNAANSGNYNLIATDGSNNLVIGDATGGNALSALLVQFAGTTALGINSGGVSTNSPLALSGGSYESNTGILRIFNTGAINWRNAANTADVAGLVVNSSDRLVMGDTTHGEIITGSVAVTTRTVTTATFTVDTTTTDNVIFANCASNSVNITLPPPTNGRKLTVIDKINNCGVGTGKDVVITPNGSEKIDNGTGGATVNTGGLANGWRLLIWSDGTDWYIESGGNL